jgi:hypothetical protein
MSLQSNYAADESVDTADTLTQGAAQVSVTLAGDINESFINHLKVSNAAGAPRKNGTVVVDGEIIYYGIFDPSDPGYLYDLKRGQDGTTAAAHSAGAVVAILGPPRFGSPALVDAVIAMQTTINDLKSRLEALEEA